MKPNPNSRSNNSTNSLLSMKDYKKPALSREKSRNNNTERRQQFDATTPKPTTFKTMKDNTSPEAYSKNNIQIKPKSTSTMGGQVHEHPRGISINVNIQNVITPKNYQNVTNLPNEHEPTPKIERNLTVLNQDSKKSRKISKLRPDADDFDFHCTQELSFHLKKGTSTKSQNTKQKYIQRPLNIENLSTVNKSKSETLKITKPTKPISSKQLLQKFYKESEQIRANSDYEALIYLDNRQYAYMVKPDYIQRKQKNFTWLMRAVVVEWIMQVCYQFSLKRETFFITINIVDRFLQKEPNMIKSDFQLVGAAAMFIASKLQEFQPKSSEQFVKTANGSYSAKQIKQMEKKICKVLKYQLNPPTLFRWANLLMTQWDGYLKENSYAEKHPLFGLRNHFYFKQLEQDSYMHFRQLVQFIDCSMLQIQTYEYNPKLLVCSFMYLVIGKEMEIFDKNQIPKFQNHSHYLIDEENMLNDLFDNFLEYTFGIKLRQLLPIVQYCSTFFSLPPNFQQPMISNAEEAEQNMQLEEYCSFQTYDKNMLTIVKKRFRGIYVDR